MKLFSTVFCLAMLVFISTASLRAQTAQFRLGAKLWDMDSLGQFVAPLYADIVVANRSSDTSVLVIEARTGVVKRTLPGPRIGPLGGFGKALAVSNDGKLCLVSTPSRIDDTSETTRLYNLSDGSLLWERKEMAVPSFVSSKHHCAFLVIWEWPVPSHVEHADLIDTRDGRTIRTFDSQVGRQKYGFPFLDEAEGRLYLGIDRWQDVPGLWIVEFSATTGEELRKWTVSAIGPFFKVPHRDSIYFIPDKRIGEADGLRIKLLDLRSNSESIALQCDMTKPTSCFDGGRREFTVSASSGDVYTTGTFQLNGYKVLPFHFDVESGRIEPVVAEQVFWEDKLNITFPYTYAPSNRTFYYQPAGPGFVRRPLICLNLDPASTGAPQQTTQDRELTVMVRGTVLEMQLPQDFRGVGRVDIIDLNGRIVLAKQVTVSDVRSEIDLGVLSAGHYVCRCALSSQTFSAPFTLSK